MHPKKPGLLLLLAVLFAGGLLAGETTIKVFTIGNSFADDATRFLPELAKSQGVEVVLRKANLGGSDMARHLRHWQASIENPAGNDGRPYRTSRTPEAKPFSLTEGLQADAWDFVTIQQLSRRSFDPSSYEPDATSLIEIVRQHAPQAEILGHQTWAYREDHPWFKIPAATEGTGDTVPTRQGEMHRRLAAAYDQLAQKHRLRLLPVGDAFQIARQTEVWRFRFPDPDFDYNQPPADVLPRQVGSLNTGWYWQKDQTAGTAKLVLDANHANIAGCYLGACVWFEVLTGRPLSENAWHPDALTPQQAASLRHAAHEAVTARQEQLAATGLRPYGANPRYWAYRGRPVLLLGGSEDDSLFQIPNLGAHLDAIREAGGNYIRNTMSDRPDRGFEISAFKRLPDGRYDLTAWNEEYWTRLENLLRWTAGRGIFVQVEIWDRFDHSQQYWETDPYNPKNNLNYTYETSGFEPAYPVHPGKNLQPFFFTTPGQRNNPVVLPFQQAFVRKLLSHTLRYDHVLYCLDNETEAEEAWATYWADFVTEEARRKRHEVFLTEMWDERDPRQPVHRRTLDQPARYRFIDISQINHVVGEEHWTRLQWTREHLAPSPRPINLVKNYGAEGSRHGQNARAAVERFLRSVIGGAAAVRFHRPPSGLGLSPEAVAAIRSLRLLESVIEPWRFAPAQSLLGEREENEAYLAADPGRAYALFFPDGGQITLDLSALDGAGELRWIDVTTGTWGPTEQVQGGDRRSLAPPTRGPWLATISQGR